jgi:hypothetical protein
MEQERNPVADCARKEQCLEGILCHVTGYVSACFRRLFACAPGQFLSRFPALLYRPTAELRSVREAMFIHGRSPVLAYTANIRSE